VVPTGDNGVWAGRDLPVFCLVSSWLGRILPCQRRKRKPLAPAFL
jgi:hypothetical protein